MAIGLIGDFRSDAVGFIGRLPTMTPDKAENLVNGAQSFIRAQAKQGVFDAVPQLKQQAIKYLGPPFAVLTALSLFGAVAGTIALRRTRRQR